MLNSNAATHPSDSVPIPLQWSPELRLLVTTACLQLTSAREQLIRELVQTEIDWDELQVLASQHGTLALLHQHLLALPPTDHLQRVLQSQREICSQSATKNLFHLGELGRVQTACKGAGVRLLTFKGPALAMEAYKSLALRTFNDIDLLIHRDEYALTRRCLFDIGYFLSPQLNEPQQQFKLTQKGTMTFRNAAGGFIDLHTHLRDVAFPFPGEFNELWLRRRTIDVAGISVETMAVDDLCVYLAVHGAKHQWGLIGWILDLALFMESPTVNWISVEERAQTLGQSRLLELGVNVAHEVLGTSIPVGSRAANDRNGKQKSRVCLLARELASELGAKQRTSGPLDYVRYQYRCHRSIKSALGLGASMVFQPHLTDWQFLPLPRALWAGYRFVRPLRLLAVRLSKLGLQVRVKKKES